MKTILLLLLPVLGMGQHITNYTHVLTPQVEDDRVSYKAQDLLDLPTLIVFKKTTLEISNTLVSETFYVDREIGKYVMIARTASGQLAIIQLLNMKAYNGKKMVVLRLSFDKEYLFFPERPWIK